MENTLDSVSAAASAAAESVWLCRRFGSGLSLAALGVFLMDVRYSLKSGALTIFMAGLASLVLFYFIMRRFLGFFFK